MKVNLTKLLEIPKNYYKGIYGETSWIGSLEPRTIIETAYAFELEVEEVIP